MLECSLINLALTVDSHYDYFIVYTISTYQTAQYAVDYSVGPGERFKILVEITHYHYNNCSKARLPGPADPDDTISGVS